MSAFAANGETRPTEPTKATKAFLRMRDARLSELKAFLRQSGCTTARKRREAHERGATREVRQ
jgi:hypothetical protein